MGESSNEIELITFGLDISLSANIVLSDKLSDIELAEFIVESLPNKSALIVIFMEQVHKSRADRGAVYAEDGLVDAP